MTSALIMQKRTSSLENSYRGSRRPCEDAGRDWSDTHKNQGMSRAQKPGRSKE